MTDQPVYLTETILTVQNEIQMALDYLETVAGQEPSQLGASPSLITVDTLRIRLPFTFQMEQQTQPVTGEETKPQPGVRLSADELSRLKSQLANRQGLLLNKQAGSTGLFSKVRILSPAPATSGTASNEENTPVLVGEIEMNFTRIPRDVEAAPPVSSTAGNVPTAPSLTGLTLDSALARIKAEGWKYELHAANAGEVAAAPQESRGKIIRQDPPANQPAEKDKTVLHLWVALSNIPIRDIDGIGDKLAERFNKIGISTIGELSLAEAARIAPSLNLTESRVQAFIDMATMMSQLTIAGLRDDVAELLVIGAGIHSPEQLSAALPENLNQTLKDALATGRVKVPRGFSFTVNDAASWIKSAKEYLNK